MRSMAVLPVVIVIVVVLAVFSVGRAFFKENKSKPTNLIPGQNQQEYQEESQDRYGMKKPFYSKDGISLQYYWPGDGSFSNEETEILLFNDSRSNLQVKSFDLTYSVEGKTYPHKSGTWEKFPSTTSWNKIEYLNISPQYYKGEPLVLNPNQKGKLHWHIQFGEKPLDGKQMVKIKLVLLKNNEAVTIDEKFNRNSGTVVSSAEH